MYFCNTGNPRNLFTEWNSNVDVINQLTYHTAIVVVDVFDPAGMMAMFNSDEAQKMAEELGVVRTPFKIEAIG